MKYWLENLLLAVFLLFTVSMAHAVSYNINYSGTFTEILDSNGNAGGSFSIGAGINIGDTYNGVFSFDASNAVVNPSVPIPNVTQYDFGVVFPDISVNGSNVNLESKVGLVVANNIDPTVETYIEGGIRELGYNPLPSSIDLLFAFTDIAGFDGSTNTGSEIILAMFDPSGLAFSDTNIPDPLSPLNNSFLIYLQTINGSTVAAGIGTTNDLVISKVPVPSALLLFGSSLLGLISVARKNKNCK